MPFQNPFQAPQYNADASRAYNFQQFALAGYDMETAWGMSAGPEIPTGPLKARPNPTLPGLGTSSSGSAGQSSSGSGTSSASSVSSLAAWWSGLSGWWKLAVVVAVFLLLRRVL